MLKILKSNKCLLSRKLDVYSFNLPGVLWLSERGGELDNQSKHGKKYTSKYVTCQEYIGNKKWVGSNLFGCGTYPCVSDKD